MTPSDALERFRSELGRALEEYDDAGGDVAGTGRMVG